MIEDKRWCADHDSSNVMLDWRLRANHRTGYWEVLFFHTKPLGIVPPDMRTRERSCQLDADAPRRDLSYSGGPQIALES